VAESKPGPLPRPTEAEFMEGVAGGDLETISNLLERGAIDMINTARDEVR